MFFLSLFSCFKPFLHLIQYEGCKRDDDSRRKLSKGMELFCVLAVCRHALDFGILSSLVGVNDSTLSHIFEGWISFAHAVFSKIDISSSPRLLKELLPAVYRHFGMEHVVLFIDATEFRLTNFTDLQLNSFFFFFEV